MKELNKIRSPRKAAGASGLLLLLALATILAIPATGWALPQMPCQIYGNVIVNGTAAPAGVVVQATIGGVQLANSVTDASGRYGYSPSFLRIPGDDPSTTTKEGAASGETIELSIDGKAVGTASYSAGGTTNVNLAFTGQLSTPVTTPTTPANTTTQTTAGTSTNTNPATTTFTPPQGSSPGTASTVTIMPAASGNFIVGRLNISSKEIQVGEKVTVQAVVKNSGNSKADYNAQLLIGKDVVKTTTLSLAPGLSDKVSFEITLDKPGQYIINLGGQQGMLTVTSKSFLKPFLIIGCGVFAVLAILLVVIIIRRRRAQYI